MSHSMPVTIAVEGGAAAAYGDRELREGVESVEAHRRYRAVVRTIDVTEPFVRVCENVASVLCSVLASPRLAVGGVDAVH